MGTPALYDMTERFVEYRASGNRGLRNDLVEANSRLVEPHVRRYRGRGIPDDDLRQHGLLALVHAVERFDPEMGVKFSTFASRTIDGEMKRLLRDRSWAVRPPRRSQELGLALRRAEEELAHRLGRAPTPRELAAQLEVDVDDVLTAREALEARTSSSLDAPHGTAETAPIDLLGAHDAGFDHVDQKLVVAELLASLPGRERTVLQLRFGDNLGQPEIAERLGLSQSYVSRLIRRTLDHLREQLEAGANGDEAPVDTTEQRRDG